jgi:CBS domain-containing protein
MTLYHEEIGSKGGPKIQVWCHDVEKLEMKGKEFFHHKINDVVGTPFSHCNNFQDISQKNPFFCLDAQRELPELLNIFKSGIHRVAVTDGDSLRVATQSNVVHFLARNISHYGLISQTSIRDLNLGEKSRLITVTSDSRAIHAFHQMYSHRVSAVAIVDKQGVLLANLSISDLKVGSKE